MHQVLDRSLTVAFRSYVSSLAGPCLYKLPTKFTSFAPPSVTREPIDLLIECRRDRIDSHTEVVHHIIPNIEAASEGRVVVDTTTHAPAATFGMADQVMVEGTDVTSDGCCIPMSRASRVVLVSSDVEGLRDHVALEGDVMGCA